MNDNNNITAEPEAKELVRKAGDRLIIFEGMKYGTLGLVRKRHALRDDQGKFRPLNDHVDNIPDGKWAFPMKHSGAVLDVLRRAARR